MRIVIADDHKLFREGLRLILARSDRCQVAAEAADGREAVRYAEQHKPDVLIIDVGMPRLNGIDACEQIRQKGCACKVLILSVHADERSVQRALQAGASGYLIKDCASEELLEALGQVAQGNIYLSTSIAQVLVHDYRGRLRGKGETLLDTLTMREREVLQLLAEGNLTKNIADSLGVCVKTIETHRRQIMEKLHVDSVAKLTKYAIREGITNLNF